MLITAILRGVQFLFAVIVLGLTVNLAKGQIFGSVPATTGFSAFAGGFGLVAALVGVAALFLEPLAGLVMVAVDSLSALFLLAGAIATVVGLKGVSCSDPVDTAPNKLLNEGCTGSPGDDDFNCGVFFESDSDGDAADRLKSRCQQDQAATAFMFMACVLTLAIAGLAFWKSKKGTGSRGVVV